MPKILDQYGNPIQEKVLREPQTARLGYINHSIEHPSRGLTPSKIAEILDDAEQGNLNDQHDLFRDMEEKDGHLFAEMQKRKLAVSLLDWHIEPPADANRKERVMAQEIEDSIRNIIDFDKVIFDILDAIGSGFSCTEIEWNQIGKYWTPKQLHFRPQSMFQFLSEDLNKILLKTDGYQGEELQPFGWITHKHRSRTGYQSRLGILRVLVWPYLYKNYSIRDFQEFLEIYGIPLRVGKYQFGASDDEKMSLLRAVTSIGHNAAGIMPESMKIDFQQAAAGTHQPFELAMQYWDQTISKIILGSTLTTTAGATGLGSNIASIHNEVRHDIRDSDVMQLSNTLTQYLVRAIQVINYSFQDPRRLCRFVIDNEDPEDLEKYANAIPKLIESGMQIPVEWMHQKLKIPMAKENAPALQQTQKAALKQEKNQEFPDQIQIDNLTPGHEEQQAQMEEILGDLLKKLEDNPALLLGEISELEPDINIEKFQKKLENSLFVAKIWGRLNG